MFHHFILDANLSIHSIRLGDILTHRSNLQKQIVAHVDHKHLLLVDDEIEEIQNGGDIVHDYYDDYMLDNEINPETKSYTDTHLKNLTDDEAETERNFQEGDI